MNRRSLALATLTATAILVLNGCGEQELYRPPESPYGVVSRLAMPTETEDVAILGDYAYVAIGQGGLKAVDISDPGNPVVIEHLDTQKRTNAIYAARTYDADGTPRDIVFVIEGTEGILTYDATAIPDTLIDFEMGTSAYYALGMAIALPDMIGDPYMVYLADNWHGMVVYESDLDFPGVLRLGPFTRTYGYALDIDVAGYNAYVADGQMGLTVIDVSNVRTGGLDLVSNIDTPGEAQGIRVVDGYAFIADGEEGLQVIKIAADQSLEHVASLSLDGECLAIDVHQGTAFLAAEDAGLHVVDIRNPESPAHLGSVITSFATGVAVGENNVVCIADRDEGLIVFRGPDLPPDNTPPAAVADLAARLIDTSSVTISWQAPGDDANQGTAAIYDIRWASAPIADSTWDSAAAIVRRPLPQPAGTPQAATLEGLTPGATYYFALKSTDDDANESALSNIAQAVMTTPVLSGGAVDPAEGDETTLFTFSVTYQDPEADAPAIATVLIDGDAHEMAVIDSAADYASGAVFTCQTTVPPGSHEFRFAFDDGHGPLITTEVFSGPQILGDPFAFAQPLVDVGGGMAFTMGSPIGETGREADEVQHEVTLTRSFHMAEIEVSQHLYRAVTGESPAAIAGLSRPVESITWFDAIIFCNALSEQEGRPLAYEVSGEVHDAAGRVISAAVIWHADSSGYRLPTEAEWEFACRAGSQTALCSGDLTFEFCECDSVLSILDELGWYCGNSDTGFGRRTQSCGRKAPNDFGLYDMHGNVWEWCWDRYGDYPAEAVADPTGPDAGPAGAQRVRRGGHWDYYARDCRSASRDAFWPNSADNSLGMRVVRNAER